MSNVEVKCRLTVRSPSLRAISGLSSLAGATTNNENHKKPDASYLVGIATKI